MADNIPDAVLTALRAAVDMLRLTCEEWGQEQLHDAEAVLLEGLEACDIDGEDLPRRQLAAVRAVVRSAPLDDEHVNDATRLTEIAAIVRAKIPTDEEYYERAPF